VEGDGGQILVTDGSRLRRALFSALFVLLGALLLYSVRVVLLPFVIAGFLSYMLEPMVALVQRRGHMRARAILIVYGILFLAFAVFVLYFVPAFVQDVQGLAAQVPELIRAVQEYSLAFRETVARYNLPAGLERGVVNLLVKIEELLAGLGDNLFSHLLSSTKMLSHIAVAPVIAYYILKDINKWRQRALVFLARYPLPYVDLLHDIDRVLSGFVRGQTIVAASVAVMMSIGLTIFGVKFSAALGLLAGLGEFIPYIGPIAATVPVAALSFMKSPATGLWVLVLVGVIQWADANLIVPRVTGSRVGLHPLWMIFALFAGGEILGLWGLFVAVPVAGVLGALLKFARAMYLSRTQ